MEPLPLVSVLCFPFRLIWEVDFGLFGRNGVSRSENFGLPVVSMWYLLLCFGGKDRDLCAEIVVPTWTDGSSCER
jgi:hypothetical protein